MSTRIYTITIAVEVPEVDRDWYEVAAAARLIAQKVTAEGLPSADEQQVRLDTGARTRAIISPAIELPTDLIGVDPVSFEIPAGGKS
jgi:hypothetical protein